MKLIDKDALVAEIENIIKEIDEIGTYLSPKGVLTNLLCHLDTFEVKDPYEQCVQYDSIKAGLQGHAETYSFNIESELFQQLTKEQQALWRKEIEQAVISGGDAGVELARDPRYKENLEVKEVDLEKEICNYFNNWYFDEEMDIMVKPDHYSARFNDIKAVARHFAEWQKKMMMKNVVLETTIIMDSDGCAEDGNELEWLAYEDDEIVNMPEWCKEGDKVMVLVIKKD